MVNGGKYALSLAFASDKATLDAARRRFTSFASEPDTLADIVSELVAPAAQQEDQLDSIVCMISASKWCEFTISMCPDGTNAGVCKPGFKIDVFRDPVTFVGSTNKQRKTFARALDTKFNRMQLAISYAGTATVSYINGALHQLRNEAVLAPSSAPALCFTEFTMQFRCWVIVCPINTYTFPSLPPFFF